MVRGEAEAIVRLSEEKAAVDSPAVHGMLRTSAPVAGSQERITPSSQAPVMCGPSKVNESTRAAAWISIGMVSAGNA